MNKLRVIIVVTLNFLRCSPHLIIFYTHHNRSLIQADTRRWLIVVRKNYSLPIGFIYLLSFFREFRNLFYNRIKPYGYFLNLFCRELPTLRIITNNIGEGLFISHGIGTSISAKAIGKNCWIGHQVSIGYQKGFPTILDNVTIFAGAVIIGKVTIGNNAIIGANATVFQNIPDNCTVYPPSPRIMKWKGKNNVTNEFEEVE